MNIRRYYIPVMVLVIVLGFGPAPRISAANSSSILAPSTVISPTAFLKPDGSLDLPAGLRGMINLDGWEVTLTPGQGPRLSPENLPLIALPDPVWEALGQGIDNVIVSPSVYSMALDSQSNLYIAGYFNGVYDAAGNPINHTTRVAKWSPYDGWSALGRGANKTARAVVVDSQDNVYFGGSFTEVYAENGTIISATNYIAKWTPGSGWSALGQGTGSHVFSLAVDGQDNLIVGGGFTEVIANNGSPVAHTNHIAKWTPGSGWSALGRGADFDFYGLAVDSQDNVYGGGAFTEVYNPNGDAVVNTVRLAKWDGSVWSALGQGSIGPVYTLEVDKQDNVYVGGAFSTVYNDSGDAINFTNNAALWIPLTGWGPLGQGAQSFVYDFEIDSNGNVYMAGNFTEVYDNTGTPVDHTPKIAKWNPTNGWSAVGRGAEAWVRALKITNRDDLYLGGYFTEVYNGSGDSIAFTHKVAKLEFLSEIFADGFESGDLSAWSSAKGAVVEENFDSFFSVQACILCVNSTFAMERSYGLKVRVQNKKIHFLTDSSPNSVTEYHFQFYIKVRPLKMDNLNTIKIMHARMGKKKPFQIFIRKKNTKFQIRGTIRTDGTRNLKTRWVILPKKPTLVEVEWKASTSPAKEDGYIKLFINGKQKIFKGGINNDTIVINQVRIGITSREKAAFNIRGSFWLDGFESHRYLFYRP